MQTLLGTHAYEVPVSKLYGARTVFKTAAGHKPIKAYFSWGELGGSDRIGTLI